MSSYLKNGRLFIYPIDFVDSGFNPANPSSATAAAYKNNSATPESYAVSIAASGRGIGRWQAQFTPASLVSGDVVVVVVSYVIPGTSTTGVVTLGPWQVEAIDINSVLGNVAGTVASVVGNVGGNVVGNVGGNVAGTVGSVVGAVGSVVGNVGGNIAGAVQGDLVGSVGSVIGDVGGSLVGNVQGTVNNSPGTTSLVAALLSRAVLLDQLDATISSRSTYAGTNTPGTTTLVALLTPTRAANLDKLDANVSTRSTYAGADTPGTTTLLTKVPDTISLANIKTQATTALSDIKLDKLIFAAIVSADVTNNSALAKLVSKSATATFSTYDNTTDSHEAIRDRGDVAWITGAGGGTVVLTDGSLTAAKFATDAISAAAVSAAAVSKITAGISGGGAGPGAIAKLVTIQDLLSVPISGVDLWVTTDSAGTNTIAGTLVTDAFGNATFLLDAGSYYLWQQKPGVNFTNPQVLDVP